MVIHFNSIKTKARNQINQSIELLKLANEITYELGIEQQLWLIDFQQNRAWTTQKNSNIVKRLEELRKQLLKHVQPRLAWEVTLLEINFGLLSNHSFICIIFKRIGFSET